MISSRQHRYLPTPQIIGGVLCLFIVARLVWIDVHPHTPLFKASSLSQLHTLFLSGTDPSPCTLPPSDHTDLIKNASTPQTYQKDPLTWGARWYYNLICHENMADFNHVIPWNTAALVMTAFLLALGTRLFTQSWVWGIFMALCLLSRGSLRFQIGMISWDHIMIVLTSAITTAIAAYVLTRHVIYLIILTLIISLSCLVHPSAAASLMVIWAFSVFIPPAIPPVMPPHRLTTNSARLKQRFASKKLAAVVPIIATIIITAITAVNWPLSSDLQSLAPSKGITAPWGDSPRSAFFYSWLHSSTRLIDHYMIIASITIILLTLSPIITPSKKLPLSYRKIRWFTSGFILVMISMVLGAMVHDYSVVGPGYHDLLGLPSSLTNVAPYPYPLQALRPITAEFLEPLRWLEPSLLT